MRTATFAVFIFLFAVAIILAALYYFKILALIALLIGFGVLIGIVIFVVVAGVVLILAVPYYLLAKEPEIDEYGTYTLEDVGGKGEGNGKEEEVKKEK